MTRGALLDLYPRRGLSFTRGEGVYLEAQDGRRFLDLMTNYGVSIFGHRHPALTRALADQLDQLTTLHGSFSNGVRVRASDALAARLSVPGASVCWVNSGTEAVEVALKLAAATTDRRRFVAARGAFHGKTLGALSATDAPKYRELLEPLLWEFVRVDYGSAEAVASAIDGRTAAVIIEPIQGEGGVVVPPDGYLRAVRAACDSAGVLLIVDEIQTGCGRTGWFTVSEQERVAPDLICLGKGIAGGIPAGVTAVSARVADAIPRGFHTSTFGGNPLACAGTLEVLSLLTPEVLSHVEEMGRAFQERLRAIDSPLIMDVRGRGLMIGVAVGDARDAVLKGLQLEGVLAIPAGSDVVRFLPPYIVHREHLEAASAALVRVLARLRAAHPR